jgi:hypothetical protein
MPNDRDGANTRVARHLLGLVIVLGSLAFWTVVPIGWLYLAGDVTSHAGGRFLLAIFGVPLMMALSFMLLSRVEAYRNELRPVTSGNGVSLLEAALVVSAVVAVIALVVWWAFLAEGGDVSGPLQPI